MCPDSNPENTIVRKIFLPEDLLEDLIVFLEFDDEKFRILKSVMDDNFFEPIDNLCIEIINKINLSDRLAYSIFLTIKYLHAVSEEKNLSGEEIIKELIHIITITDAIKEDGKENVINNMNTNKSILEEIFEIQRNNALNIKEKNLQEQIINIAIRSRTICDLRPMFNVKKDKIEKLIPIIIMEFFVRRPDGSHEQILVNLTEEGFKELQVTITETKGKLKEIKEKCILVEETDG